MNWRGAIFAVAILLVPAWISWQFVEAKIPHYVDGYRRVSLAELAQFDFDPSGACATDIPARLRHLDGQRVWINGRIFHADAAAMTHWEMIGVLELSEWGPKRAQERVYCSAPKGKSFERLGETANVFGVLHVAGVSFPADAGAAQPMREVYRLDVERFEGR